jgi:hypothetical protein
MPWLLSIYPGFLIAPLAVWGAVSGSFKTTRVWIAVGGLSLLLALGDNTPFYKPFYHILPIFRFPEKFVFISNFCLLALAAPGIDALLRLVPKRRVQPALIASLLAVVLSADLYISHRHLNPLSNAAAYTHHHPDLQPILKDPSLFRVFVDTSPPPGTLKPQSIIDHHVKWQLQMMPNLGVMLGLHQVGGKTALELQYQYFMTEILSKPWSQKLLFLKMANVKYILSRHPLDKHPDLAGLVEPVNALVYRLKAPLPRAWLVGQVQAVPEMTLADFLAIDFNPAGTALGSPALAANHAISYYNPARSVSHDGNRIRIDVSAAEPSLLVLAESGYPGWKGYVDGVEKDILRLNLFFQGIEIESGRHQVEFIFRPDNFFLFLALSVVSLAVVSVALVVFNLKRR